MDLKSLIGHRSSSMTPEEYHPEVDVFDVFWKATRAVQRKRVLEIGTLQSIPGRSTHMRGMFPDVEDIDYVRMDIEGGPDVDIIADLHRVPTELHGGFDVFIANAVFEHLERPWVAAGEVTKLLRPGGTFLVSTHQTFPIHAYPSDFFRFSKHALRLIFEDAGLVVDACDYQERCLIVPPEKVVPGADVLAWNKVYPAYILVNATGHKA